MSKEYVICLWHPHTLDYDDINIQTEIMLKKVTKFCQDKDLDLFWFLPNNDCGFVKIMDELAIMPVGYFNIVKNLIGEDFLKLLANCRFIIGNSSAAIRESSFLGVPAVNVGGRQNGRVCADNVIHCDFDDLDRAMEDVMDFTPDKSDLFGDGNASEKIIKELKKWLK